jgi:hypothetical protein
MLHLGLYKSLIIIITGTATHQRAYCGTEKITTVKIFKGPAPPTSFLKARLHYGKKMH